MKFSNPKIEVGSLITTFQNTMPGITPKKLYVVEYRNSEWITLRNDLGQVKEYRSICFMEADVVYSILLLTTFNRLFGEN
jgi:hypothetical protein